MEQSTREVLMASVGRTMRLHFNILTADAVHEQRKTDLYLLYSTKQERVEWFLRLAFLLSGAWFAVPLIYFLLRGTSLGENKLLHYLFKEKGLRHIR